MVHICCLTKEVCSSALYTSMDISSSQQHLSIYSWLIMEAEHSFCSNLFWCQWEVVVREERGIYFLLFQTKLKLFPACCCMYLQAVQSSLCSRVILTPAAWYPYSPAVQKQFRPQFLRYILCVEFSKRLCKESKEWMGTEVPLLPYP